MSKGVMTRERWLRARELGRSAWVRRTLALPVLMAVGLAGYKAQRYGVGEEFWETAALMTVLLVFTSATVLGVYDRSERAHC